MMYYKQMHASYVTVPAYRWNQRELDDDEKSYIAAPVLAIDERQRSQSNGMCAVKCRSALARGGQRRCTCPCD